MEIIMKPIGEVISVGEAKQETERFSDRQEVIEIYPEFVEGLTDIVPGKKLQILFYFHKSEGYNCIAFSHFEKRMTGLFNTRCPMRPNGIGVTVVDVLAVDGGRLTVDGADMLEGTPILDIKPWNIGPGPGHMHGRKP